MSESITEDFATIRLRVAEIEAERAKWLAAAPIEEVQFDQQSDVIDVTSEWIDTRRCLAEASGSNPFGL